MTAQPNLVDSHAHLDFPQFEGRVKEVLERARLAGVSNVITVGTSYEETLRSLEIAAEHEGVSAAGGVHPNYVSEKFGGWPDLKRLFETAPLVAVGETGLDFYRDHTPREMQREAFRAHLEIGLERDLPVIIHVRDAYDEALKLIDSLGAVPRGVFHCFSGDWQFAEEVLKRGFFISVAGQVTFKNAQALQEVVSTLPLGRLLVETDCPYLAPVPNRGKTNEPAFVRHTALKVTELTGVRFEDLARAVTVNAWRLFKVGDEPPKGVIAYALGENLYLNITNRCPNACPWCVRFRSPFLSGYHLALEDEPSFEEIIAAVGDPSPYREVVFCGYGEPTERLDILKRVAAWLHSKGAKVRLDTSGLGSLCAGRNIVPELSGLVDSVSISLNAPDAAGYERLCRSKFGPKAHEAVVSFTKSAKETIGKVTLTAVSLPDVDTEAVKALSSSLGIPFRLRRYKPYG